MVALESGFKFKHIIIPIFFLTFSWSLAIAQTSNTGELRDIKLDNVVTLKTENIDYVYEKDSNSQYIALLTVTDSDYNLDVIDRIKDSFTTRFAVTFPPNKSFQLLKDLPTEKVLEYEDSSNTFKVIFLFRTSNQGEKTITIGTSVFEKDSKQLLFMGWTNPLPRK